MPAIRKNTDLLDNYRKPIFIKNNGQGDLTIIGIEASEEINGKLELYQKILIGLNQIKNGETVSEEKMMSKIKQYALISR